MGRRPAARRVRVAFRPARARYRTRAAASLLKPVLLAAAAGGALVWTAQVAREAWAQAAWARVEGISVAPGSLQDGTPPEGFARAVGVEPGSSLFSFSSGDTARRLEDEFPELASVRLRRTLDKRVKVVYRRRRAAAKVWEGGQWLGMDPAGELFPLRVFAPEEEPPQGILPEESARPLPILSEVPAGAGARAALVFVELLRRLPQPWARGFYKMKLASTGEAILYLKDGPIVRWGDLTSDEARVRAKADRLERVLEDPRWEGAAPESVRFVDDRRLAVKPKSGKGS